MPALDANGLSAPEVRPYRVLITGFGVSDRRALLAFTFSIARLTVREPSHSIAIRSIHHGWLSSHFTTPS
jgi:hypothetical protein